MPTLPSFSTLPCPHLVRWRSVLFFVLLLAPCLGVAQVRIMSMGNSITQGDTKHNTYRRPLWQKLQAGGYNIDFVGSLSTNNGGPNPNPDFDVDHEGHWGLRADELVVNARNWATIAQPNMVLLHAGSNDIDQGQTIASTRDDVSKLIDELRLGQPTVTVLLAQLLPTTNLNNNNNYITFNALLPALAQQKSTAQSQVIIVDQYTGFSAATETTDGVHPNAAGEEKMATRWYAALQALLPPPATGDFTLTVTTSGYGYVIKNTNQLSYLSGTTVSLLATPAAGFIFTGWSGNATGNTNPLTVTMSTSKTITATFSSGTAPQQVASYTLVNADTRGDIQTLTNGTTLNLATLPTRHLNIRANTNPATVGSVIFALSGAQAQNQTENMTPYALFSDNNGAYNSWTPRLGSYSLTARPYTGGSGGGTPGTALAIAFSVIDQATGQFTLTVNTAGSGTVSKSPDQLTYLSGTNVTLTATPASGFQLAGWSGAATGSTNPLTISMTADKTILATFTAVGAAQQVIGYTLVNADSDLDLQPLTDGTVLNLATLTTRNLNIRANTSPATVGSIVFALRGAVTRNQTESVVPYALFGDNGAGDYSPWVPAVGSYTLTARPYTGGSGTGTGGTALAISFSVQNQSTKVLAQTTTSSPLRASAYPNPSIDNRYTVQLPEAIQGEVSYVLRSAYGIVVATGQLELSQATTTLPFDFSRQMQSVGVYYLFLKVQHQVMNVRLLANQ